MIAHVYVYIICTEPSVKIAFTEKSVECNRSLLNVKVSVIISDNSFQCSLRLQMFVTSFNPKKERKGILLLNEICE